MSELPGLSSLANQDHTENRSSDNSTNDAASDHALAGSGSPSDPASSLRAAALLTMKPKRRKPTADQPAGLPQRPIPSGLMLNYGEEESSPPTTAASSALDKASTPPGKVVALQVEDNREEGEISDTEATPPAKPKASPRKTQKAKATAAVKKSIKASPKTSPTSAKPPSHAKLPPTSPKQEISLPTPVDGPSAPLAPAFQHGPPQTLSYVVDADHVRPGLAMNAQQYEAAKDIVLDLLGWGVEPEYLTEAGVSRETIFYVFTELRLRLPRNLNTQGLVPYFPPPPEPTQIPPAATQARPQRSNSSSMAMPPPPSIPPRHEAASRVTHPSLPQRPHPSQSNPPSAPSVSRSTTASGQLTVLTTARDLQLTQSAGANPDLHEIEQLRKQELIARKAVQASRKTKAAAANAAGPASSSSVASTPVSEPRLKDKDVEMANPVPAKSVDDFLKTIPSVSDDGKGKADSPVTGTLPTPFRRHASPEAMDVDEIPGLSGGDTPLSRPLSAYSLTDEPMSRASTASGAPTEPPSSTDSNPDFPEAAPDEAGGSHYLMEDIPPGTSNFQHAKSSRRGTKRPVASDFVDFETGPPRPYSTNGYSTSSGGSQPPSMRRKATASFASVSGMRRCVIDLSDSEDEGDGHRTESDERHRTYSPLPSRALPTSSSMPQLANGSDRPSSQYHSNGNSGAQSPAALYAKEEEIKRMRELIAQREQSRLRKLAVMSRATPTSVTPAPVLPTVKQEDDDSPAIITNGHSHDITTTTVIPDGVTEGPPRKDSGSIIPLDPAVPTSASGNTSASATPPIADDFDSSAAENANPGDQVLTAEARQEHVATFRTTRPDQVPSVEAVDVNDSQSSSSTQVPQAREQQPQHTQDKYQQPQASGSFPTYNSPFNSYPLLRSKISSADDASRMVHQRQAQASPSFLASSFIVSARYLVPDLKPLKRAASFRALDPSGRVCQYELPGGGVCRDEGCLDVHLSRGVGVDEVVEPSDADTAEYLYDAILTADNSPHWINTQERRVIVGRLRDALRGLHGTGKGYEERVAEALATLSPPRPPSTV